MLDRLRRVKFVDGIFRTVEAYTSLGEQYPWVKWAINSVVAVVLASAIAITESWVPLGIVAGLAAFVALAFLPAAIRQSSEQPKRRTEVSAGNRETIIEDRINQIEVALLNIIYIEGMRVTKDILKKWIDEAPDIPKLQDRDNFNIDLLQKELAIFEEYWKAVEEQLVQTIFVHDCRNIMITAEGAADAEVRSIGKIPNDLPPFEFRSWFIARNKAQHILDFMRRKKTALDKDMLFYLSKLEEQRRNVQVAKDRRG